MASAISLHKSQTGLIGAMLYFPVAAYLLLGLGSLPLGLTSAAALGWITYLSLTGIALFARKRFAYYVIYLTLCMLLLLNVVGCYALSWG
jgi:hypothetical protein